jgi:predicted dehydrogenase
VSELRVGIVGSGFWASEMHLPAFATLPGVRVTHVSGGSPERARQLAERFGVARWSVGYDDLVADPDVDVVDIVAPNDVHAPATMAAAEHGKHVICIKPLARTSAEAREMLAATASAGVRLLYAENVPFIPAVQRLKEIVDAGEIGEVFRVKACEGIARPHSAWFLDPARSGGGVLIDMAVHSVAFCRFVAGAEPVSVYAEIGNFTLGGETPAEDTAVLTMRFADGAIGQCEDSWSLTGAMDSRFEVFGTTGRVLIDNLHRQPIQVVTGEGGWTHPLPIPGAIADGHVAMLGHFVDALRTGERASCEGEDGLALLLAIEAAMRSAASGRAEQVDDVRSIV